MILVKSCFIMVCQVTITHIIYVVIIAYAGDYQFMDYHLPNFVVSIFLIRINSFVDLQLRAAAGPRNENMFSSHGNPFVFFNLHITSIYKPHLFYI